MTDQPGSEKQLQDSLSHIEFLIERNRLDQAMAEIGKLLGTFPDNPQAMYFAAWIDWRHGRQGETEQTVTRLLAIEPHHYGGRRLLADIYDEQDKGAAAEQMLIGLLKDYPEDADIYADYAWLMLKHLEIDKAGRLAAEALRREPEDVSALRVSVICRLVEGGADADTYAQLEDLSQRYPDLAETGTVVVAVLMERGRSKEALMVAQDLLRANPTSPEMLQLVKELRYASHWSMIPMRPLMRWGWRASIVIWFVVVIGWTAVDKTPLEPYGNTAALVFLCYVVYSWVYPPILRKIMVR